MVPAPTKAGFASIKTNQRKRLSKRELNITPHYGCSRVGAGTTIKSDANEVVPAPRLELQSGSLNDLRSILYELAKNAKLEMKRGNKGAVEELLQVFIESGEKFSTFEKNILENGKRSEPFAKGGKGSAPFAGFSKGLPFVAEGSQ